MCGMSELCFFWRVGCQKIVVLSHVGCQSFDSKRCFCIVAILQGAVACIECQNCVFFRVVVLL